jgi:hypothetical protein
VVARVKARRLLSATKGQPPTLFCENFMTHHPTAPRHSVTAGAEPCHHADALELLRSDHEEARALAEECRRIAHTVAPEPDIAQVERTAETLCHVLRILAEIEEELFYPAARAALPTSVIDVAKLEHATAKEIIRQMELTDPCEPRYEALLLALSDCVERHVHHEQSELFPRVLEAHLDLETLGERMSLRQEQLRSHH